MQLGVIGVVRGGGNILRWLSGSGHECVVFDRNPAPIKAPVCRWTINADIEEAVQAEVLSAAHHARFRSREQQSFADKPLSTVCNEFGGHVESKADR
jgi:6-phosphogluconate dehydrogenase (decarboxylating)